MAKKKKTRRVKPTFSLAVAGGFIPMATKTIGRAQTEGIEGAGDELARSLTGYSPKNKNWSWTYLKTGLFPIGAGVIVHKVASALGINRAIGRAKIPFVRI